MGSFLPVLLGVTALVPAAPNVAADQADPEVRGFVADAAEVRYRSRAEGSRVWVFRAAFLCSRLGIGGAANRAAEAFPGLETSAVKDVLAKNGHETGCIVHTLKTDSTGW